MEHQVAEVETRKMTEDHRWEANDGFWEGVLLLKNLEEVPDTWVLPRLLLVVKAIDASVASENKVTDECLDPRHRSCNRRPRCRPSSSGTGTGQWRRRPDPGLRTIGRGTR